jgi:DNA repair protein RadC
MKALAPQDRPREKLERLGVAGLGDNELLALVLGNGSRGRDALELANSVLEQTGGLHRLPRVSLDELHRLGGIGRVRAAQTLAAVELGRRTMVPAIHDRPRLRSPEHVAAYLLPLYGARAVEQFGVMMLDTKHRLIRIRIVAVGSLDTTVVHPREVFREAIAASAAAIILFHNHPSGDPTPSPDDVDLTKRMATVGLVMGIDVVDHVILADQQYFSFLESGRIEQARGVR